MSELQPDGTWIGPPRIEYYHLDLVLAKGYLGNLLGNPRVVRYLVQNHREILVEFQKIAELKSAAA